MQVDRVEMYATLVTFIGAIIINFDTKAQKMDTENTNIIFGNFLALLSGICGVITVVSVKHLTEYMKPRELTFV